MKIIYICGPIRSESVGAQYENIGRGIAAAKAIWQAGGAAICPHMFAYFWGDDDALRKLLLEGELEMIRRCDAVLALPGWMRSVGASAEVCFARGQGITILESLEEAVRWVKL